MVSTCYQCGYQLVAHIFAMTAGSCLFTDYVTCLRSTETDLLKETINNNKTAIFPLLDSKQFQGNLFISPFLF